MLRFAARLPPALLLTVTLASASLGWSARTARAQDDDWAVERDPFDPRVVGRYKRLLETNPADAQALRRLVALYAKHATLERLVGEYEAVQKKSPGAFAPLVILGHLARHRGNASAAVGWYEQAARARPTDATATIALGDLHRQAQRIAEARAAYERATTLVKRPAEQRQLLEALAELALLARDVTSARAHFAALVALDPADVRTRLALADALARHELHVDALAEYREAEARLRADPARRVVALARIGGELAALERDDEALAVWRQAMALTERGHHLRRELTERIIELHRRKQDLRGLVLHLEQATPAAARGYFEWEILARLLEEIGEQEQAITAYRHAVKAGPHELDTHRRFIALLERAGRDDQALAAYEAVAAIAPGEPRFQLELATRHFERGDKKRALALCGRLAQRFGGDAGVRSALAELYTRFGEADRALREHEALVQIEPGDEHHLVELGEQHFQRGDHARAVEIWQRIAAARTPEATARLAEVYSDHDLGQEAIDTFRKAIELARAAKKETAALHRGLALAHERLRQDDPAAEEWLRVLALAEGDQASRSTQREARQRYVANRHRQPGSVLAGLIRRWERSFAATPPDLDAGHFLIEAHLAQSRSAEAERFLRRLLAMRPDDDEAMSQLVTVLRAQHKLSEAIVLLKQLAERFPAREREYFTELAELALLLYHDDEAVKYALRSLEKAPQDPQAQARLGEIYEKKDELERAVEAYRAALRLGSRDAEVQFSLARLYVRRGERDAAARIYRELLRRANDDEVIRKAARKALDLEEYLGTLGALQAELAPLAFLFPDKRVYRNTLVELYDRLVPPLALRATRGDATARVELRRLGEQGLAPLLEALNDADEPQQRRVALAVLGHVGNRDAVPALLQLAERTAASGSATAAPELDERVGAIISAGRLADPRAVPALTRLAAHRETTIREAALWALGRTGDARAATPLLAALAADQKPSTRSLACIGLARTGDRRAFARIAETLRAVDTPAEVRSACAFAIGAAGQPAQLPELLAILAEGQDDAQAKAAWALGRLGDRRAMAGLLAAYLGKREPLRTEIVAALVRLESPSTAMPPLPDEELLVEGGKLDHRHLLRSLTAPQDSPPAKPSPRLIVGHEEALVATIIDHLGRHRDQLIRVLDDLAAREDGLGLGDLTHGLTTLSAHDRQSVEASLARIAARIVPAVVALTRHREPLVRERAAVVLARTRAPDAAAHLVLLAADPDARVRAAASAASVTWLGAVGHAAPGADEVVRALVTPIGASAWRERILAARTLGDLGPLAPVPVLARAARDPSGFVREAAVHALGRAASPSTLDAVLVALLDATTDEVGEVRLAATVALVAILPTLPSPSSARVRLGELATGDPDPRVRTAASAR